MRKILVLLLMVIIIGIGVVLSSKFTDKNAPESTSVTGQVPSKKEGEADAGNRIRKAILELEGNSYTILIRKLQAREEVTLISNFKEAYSSAEVLSSNHCDFISNGGFYTKENSPLGLFFLKGEKLANYLESDFLNGIISKNRNGDITLSSNQLSITADLEFALQSGPYFSLKSEIIQGFENEKARRSLIAQDSKGETYFLAVYDSGNTFSGPDLGQIKKLLSAVNDNSNLKLASAINLDGGSTLAFLQTGEDSIPEVKKSGSFFCIKNK